MRSIAVSMLVCYCARPFQEMRLYTLLPIHPFNLLSPSLLCLPSVEADTIDNQQCTGSFQTGCMPAGENCLYTANWRVLGDRVQFNVSARIDADSWVAIGFSNNLMMVSLESTGREGLVRRKNRPKSSTWPAFWLRNLHELPTQSCQAGFVGVLMVEHTINNNSR